LTVLSQWRRRLVRLLTKARGGGIRQPGLSLGLQPLSRKFGFDRGQPIDRYYIEAFLNNYRSSIKGSVLEIGDDSYTKAFGSQNVVTSHVLHAVPGNPRATFVGNFETGEGIPERHFDCIICTQTFSVTYDVRSAIKNTFNALVPGGILLATVPGISQISRHDMDQWGDFWRFTDASATRSFGEVFGSQNVQVRTFGNLLASCAFLNGCAVEELSSRILDYHDPDYQLLVSISATRR
jgi:hypothetical protein